MFKAHPNLITPDSPTVLWRYLDLAKLLFLLEHDALWFARLDTLGDPYEGLPPKPFIDEMWAHAEAVPEAEREERLRVARHNTRAFGIGREILAVSCWHANPVESAAMWNLYGKVGEGIALRTTSERLERSFCQEHPQVYGGMIRYVDFESHAQATPVNIFDWATLKRTSFSHEREFRAIVMGETGPLVAGVAVPVDINVLIEGVYVAPAAERWYAELVRRACARFRLNAGVVQSELLAHPAYMERGLTDGGAV